MRMNQILQSKVCFVKVEVNFAVVWSLEAGSCKYLNVSPGFVHDSEEWNVGNSDEGLARVSRTSLQIKKIKLSETC